MKFDYAFNVGDVVYYHGDRHTITRRVGKYDVPHYVLGNLSFSVAETQLSIYPQEEKTEETVKETNKSFKARLRRNLADYSNTAPNLSKYSRNLNLLAIEGKLNPTYCREKEIKDIETILLRRTKPNTILTGQAGCGKTAIVEELARVFVNKKLNDISYDMPIIFDLSLNSLISGARYRGDFEERLDNIIKEVQNNKNIIIFIDEIHSLNYIGNSDGAVSAGQILKPALARGEIRCIGATTTEEYEKYIAPDKALARRFSKINVAPLMGETRNKCITNILDEYGKYFNINTASIPTEHIVNILDNFMPNTTFPNNVIDIIDETLATAKYDNKDSITIKDINATVSRITGMLII